MLPYPTSLRPTRLYRGAVQVSSTNIGNVITVGFNLASREAYSGDWGWILGGVDASLTLEEANGLSADEANDAYDERCRRWYTRHRAIATNGL